MELSSGPLALVGSGEYLPSMLSIERDLLSGRSPRYVQLATAAAPEGQVSLDHWHALGAAQAQRLGVEQVVIDVRTRADADDPRWVDLITGAGLVYLSGGNPSYLVQTLRDTLVWQAIESQWRAGAALAGCSAGAMAMAGSVPSLRHPFGGGESGLGLVPDISVLPHFDRMGAWVPAPVLRALSGRHGPRTIGIDEETAMVGYQGRWIARGRQRVWVFGADGRTSFGDGEEVAW
ncbi:MAG TPA: peptidase [Actinobacteria bacterium]|nr:peptidase [Actinomycetota bacterium]